MADFPNSIFSPREVENLPGVDYDPSKTKNLYAEDINLATAEIVAIETILGENPQGAYDTVADRLDAGGGGGGGSWGSITGDIDDQADLQAEFDTKQDVLGYTPEDVANKKTTTTLGTSDTFYPTQKAVKTYVDNGLSGKQNSLGYTPEDVSNKSTNASLGSSNTLYPSQKAVKDYVDNEIDDLPLPPLSNVYIPWPVYFTSNGAMSNSGMPGATTLYFASFVLPIRMEINYLAYRINTLATNGKIRWGIYSADGQTKLFDQQTGTITATGVNTMLFAAPLELQPGQYVLAWTSDGTISSNITKYPLVATYGPDYYGVTNFQKLVGTLATTGGNLPSFINYASATATSTGIMPYIMFGT